MTLPVWRSDGVLTCAERPVRVGPRALVWALVATGALVLAVQGTGIVDVPAGAPDPGALTRWGEVLTRLGLDGGWTVLVGVLVALSFLTPAEQTLPPTSRRLLRVGVAAAWCWCLAAVLSLVLSASALSVVPVSRAAADPGLLTLALDVPRGRALALVTLVALVAAMHLGAARTRLHVQVVLATVVASSLPLLASGHAGSVDHLLVAQAAVVHFLAVSVWVGGLVAMLLLMGQREVLAHALPRYSTLALACYVAAAAGGVVTAVAVLGIRIDRWQSTYGALLGLKLVALTALGVAGWLHRRRTLPAIAAGSRGSFVRLATAEVGVMAAAAALGIAVSVTAPPVGSLTDRGVGSHSSALHVGPVVLSLGLLALAVYVAAALAAWSYGQRWPVRRVGAWAGVVALAVVLAGISHQPEGASASTASLVGAAVALPVLVLAARPLELTRVVHERPPGWNPWPRPAFVTDPVNAAALLIAGVIVLARLGPQDRGDWPWWASGGVLVGAALIGVLGLAPLVTQHPDDARARTAKERSVFLALLGLGLAGSGARAAWVVGETGAGAWFGAGSAVLLVVAAVVRTTSPTDAHT